MKRYLLILLCTLLLCSCGENQDNPVSDGDDIATPDIFVPEDGDFEAPGQRNYRVMISSAMGSRTSTIYGDGKSITFLREGQSTTFAHYDEWNYLVQGDNYYHIIGDFDFDIDDYISIDKAGLELSGTEGDLEVYRGSYAGKESDIAFSVSTGLLSSITTDDGVMYLCSPVEKLYLSFDPYVEMEEISAEEAKKIYNSVEFMPLGATDPNYVPDGAQIEEPLEGPTAIDIPEPEVTDEPEPEVTDEPEVPVEPEVTDEPEQDVGVTYILITGADYTNISGCYDVFGTEADTGVNTDNPETAQFQFGIGDAVYCWPSCPVDTEESVTYEAFRSILDTR